MLKSISMPSLFLTTWVVLKLIQYIILCTAVYLQGLMLMTCWIELIRVLLLLRKMLVKDKKPPEEKGSGKEPGQVIPTRPETPKLFKAALVVGKGETFAKLKETYKDAEATVQVLVLSMFCAVFGGQGKSAESRCSGVLANNQCGVFFCI